jgi:tripeptide aminopeptidase
MPANEHLDAIRNAARTRLDATAELAMRICEVPSPTGHEQDRARFIAALLEERGYAPEIDEVSNVYARRGDRGGHVLLVDAHIDTVFPPGTEINARREDGWLYGPGIGDNSLSVAAMITAIDILDELEIETPVDIVFAGVVGEEGLGNLRGAHAAARRLQPDLGAVLVIDGRQGGITHVAVGSNRWKLTVRGPGGHSFGAFGTPSAIHGLGRIIGAISELVVPEEPKTTYNVGVIDGGTSVNTIAPEATAIIDMRSTDADALAELSDRVQAIIESRVGDGLETTVEVVGERPAGSIPKDDRFVQLAAETIRWLGQEPEFRAASTNLNVPLSLGIPGVCVGISRGERTHTVHEHIPIEPIPDGVAQVVRLCMEMTRKIGES